MKDPKIFLIHIRDSINHINKFSKNLTKSKFMKDRLRQNAIVRELEIIGEAVKNIPVSFRKKNSSVEWVKISGLRDKLIHHYFGLDLEIIWRVIKQDMPDLEEEIIKILNQKEICKNG